MIGIQRSTAALACGIVFLAGAPAVSANEELREELLNTVDNLGATAAALQMAPALQEQIERARDRVEMASPSELYAIPQDLYSSVRTLELSSAQMRLAFDPSAVPGKAKGMKSRLERSQSDFSARPEATPAYQDSDLANPAYPSLSWTFSFSDGGEPGDGPDSGSGGGICSYPGYAYNTRFITLNTAIALEAVKDMAEQACNQDILGENVSLLCVVTDAAAFVAKGVDANQDLCNDFMTAAEVSATWAGLNTVHGNVQNVYDSVAAHDAAIASQVNTHDAEIKTLLAEILGKQDAMLGNQATIIELLNTPQGQRPDWPNKN